MKTAEEKSLQSQVKEGGAITDPSEIQKFIRTR